MYPDTSDFFAMEGMITYSALGEFSAVADFYRQQMAAQGWNLDNETDMAGVMAQQSWSKGGRSVEIMISPADGNSSAVVITLSE
jgi:hypothetical protein